MGILIRSPHVEQDPVVLPLFTEHRSIPTLISVPTPSAELHAHTTASEAPANMTDFASPGGRLFTFSDSDEPSEEVSPPDLDPELKLALLDEMSSARNMAVKEGFVVGHAQGLAESRQLLQEQIDALTKLLNSATEVLQSQIVGLEDIVVALGFETVCKIMGSALHDRECVVAVVRQVISHVKESEPITIRVAPADFEHLVENQAAITQTHFSSGITLQPDDRVVLGGCLIETSGGSLDGRLETQLQQVRDALLGAQRQRVDWQEALHAL